MRFLSFSSLSAFLVLCFCFSWKYVFSDIIFSPGINECDDDVCIVKWNGLGFLKQGESAKWTDTGPKGITYLGTSFKFQGNFETTGFEDIRPHVWGGKPRCKPYTPDQPDAPANHVCVTNAGDWPFANVGCCSGRSSFQYFRVSYDPVGPWEIFSLGSINDVKHEFILHHDGEDIPFVNEIDYKGVVITIEEDSLPTRLPPESLAVEVSTGKVDWGKWNSRGQMSNVQWPSLQYRDNVYHCPVISDFTINGYLHCGAGNFSNIHFTVVRTKPERNGNRIGGWSATYNMDRTFNLTGNEVTPVKLRVSSISEPVSRDRVKGCPSNVRLNITGNLFNSGTSAKLTVFAKDPCNGSTPVSTRYGKDRVCHIYPCDIIYGISNRTQHDVLTYGNHSMEFTVISNDDTAFVDPPKPNPSGGTTTKVTNVFSNFLPLLLIVMAMFIGYWLIKRYLYPLCKKSEPSSDDVPAQNSNKRSKRH